MTAIGFALFSICFFCNFILGRIFEDPPRWLKMYMGISFLVGCIGFIIMLIGISTFIYRILP